uniref:G-protein coupled receptors family 1 profile domain-containing protein n=1 Tax=Panagrolaimus sp. JU765 TaxID=591449 RepID=A0AC34RR81_9BILA
MSITLAFFCCLKSCLKICVSCRNYGDISGHLITLQGLAVDSLHLFCSMLSGDDIFAGVSMILIGIVGIGLHALEFGPLRKLAKKFFGFKLIIGQSLIDVLLLFQFGIWPGIVCLTKNTLIPVEYKTYAHVYLDTTWFSMCYMTVIIALSRLFCIIFPLSFWKIATKYCYAMYALAYSTAFIQSVIVHLTDWFVCLYYDPEVYGTTGDFAKYQNVGTALYYHIVNFSVVGSYVLCYLSVVVILLARKRQLLTFLFGSSSTSDKKSNLSQNVELRLMIPCMATALLFIIGQILINGSLGTTKWTGYFVMIIFSFQSLCPPVLRFLFSPSLKNEVIRKFRNISSSPTAPQIKDVTSMVPRFITVQNSKENVPKTLNKQKSSEVSPTLFPIT